MTCLKPTQTALTQYYQQGYWQKRSLGMLIAEQVSRHPGKNAAVDASGQSITYAQLEDKASRFAAFLKDRQIARGDVVTMHLPNWWQTLVVAYATFKLGAVINPLPPTYGWKDLAYVLNKAQAKAIVAPGRFRSADYTEHISRIHDLLKIKPEIILIGKGNVDLGTSFDDAIAGPTLEQDEYASPDEASVLLFTSGSESRPKGVVHTHNTVIFGEAALSGMLGLTDKDVCFMASPVSHTSGFMHGILMTLNIGSSVSLLDVFKGDRAVEQMAKSEATWTMGATPFLIDVVQSMQRTGQRLPALRYFLCGGAPIPEIVVRQAREVGLRVLSIYGSTESPPHTVTWPSDPESLAWQADGRPLPGIEVRVVDDSGRDVPQGEEGEQLSRGPNTFIGYLDEPELTAKALDADGWYRSGDLARITEDGSVRIVGRRKDVIIRGGQNISVREVEDVLLKHPACEKVAIVGIPHSRLGEVACAVVVSRAGQAFEFDDMVSFLTAQGIARFKLPEHLVLRDQLPVTASGKIQKFKLRQELKSLGAQ